MIRKHFAGVVVSAQALGVPAQAFAGTVVFTYTVKTITGEVA